jgi:hypothetical protein
MLQPTVLKYDASAIPVGNLVISSTSRSDRDLRDLADNTRAAFRVNPDSPRFSYEFEVYEASQTPLFLENHGRVKDARPEPVRAGADRPEVFDLDPQSRLAWLELLVRRIERRGRTRRGIGRLQILPLQGYPHRHFGASAVAPGVVGDQPQLDGPHGSRA